MRPPFETFTKPTCRGSYVLGTACGHCEKCEWERAHLNDPRPREPGWYWVRLTPGYDWEPAQWVSKTALIERPHWRHNGEFFSFHDAEWGEVGDPCVNQR